MDSFFFFIIIIIILSLLLLLLEVTNHLATFSFFSFLDYLHWSFLI